MSSASEKPTEVLVREATSGDQQAFAELVDRYRDAASAVAYSRLGGFDDAQDAVQEAFIHAFCNLGQLREPAKFGPWLRKITANACAMVLRKRERTDVSLDDVPDQPSSSDESRKVAAREVVREALGKLSDATRLTVTLSYINGYSHAEIADFLELPITAVRSRLRHAKRKLREEMIDMVEEVLHEDKPGEELVRKILQSAVHLNDAMAAGATDQALHLCDEALAAVRAMADSESEDEIRSTLIRAVEAQGTFADADERARVIDRLGSMTMQQIQAQGEAEVIVAKASLHLVSGRVEEARLLFDQGLELAKGSNSDYIWELITDKVAGLCDSRHHTELGKDYLPMAIEAAGKAGDVRKQAMDVWMLASAFLDEECPSLARPYVEDALDLFKQADQPALSVMAQAMLDLIDELGNDRWGMAAEWLVFCLPVRKTSAGVERVIDRGGGFTSDRDDRPPRLSILWGSERYWSMDESAIDIETSSQSSSCRIPAEWPSSTAVNIKAHSQELTVLAGAFTDCLVVEETTIEDGEPPAHLSRALVNGLRAYVFGTRRYWFARGVGLVRYETDCGDGFGSAAELASYNATESSTDYLPLAIGNSWTYTWVDAPEGRTAKEHYRVAANEGENWYLANYRCVLKDV